MMNVTRSQADWLASMCTLAAGSAIEDALAELSLADATAAERIRRRLQAGLAFAVSDVFEKSAHPEIALQEIQHTEGRTVIGYEALARFGGGVGPVAHFREAAQYGLEVELELATLGAALARMDELPHGVYLGVNISAKSLVDERLSAVLDDADNGRLVLELTQQSNLLDVQQLRRRFSELQDIGAVMAVDCAGVGFFRGDRLVELRPEMIKIDRSYVAGCDRCEDKRAQLKKLIAIGRRIGAFVVGTGVESEAECDVLASLGVDAIQGYHLDEPSVDLRVATTAM